jgi:hypothetical protein
MPDSCFQLWNGTGTSAMHEEQKRAIVIVIPHFCFSCSSKTPSETSREMRDVDEHELTTTKKTATATATATDCTMNTDLGFATL